MFSTPVRSLNFDPCFAATADHNDADQDAHDRRQDRRDPPPVLPDDEADDSEGPGNGPGPAEVHEHGGGARARDGLHGRDGADALGLGAPEQKRPPQRAQAIRRSYKKTPGLWRKPQPGVSNASRGTP